MSVLGEGLGWGWSQSNVALLLGATGSAKSQPRPGPQLSGQGVGRRVGEIGGCWPRGRGLQSPMATSPAYCVLTQLTGLASVHPVLDLGLQGWACSCWGLLGVSHVHSTHLEVTGAPVTSVMAPPPISRRISHPLS